MEDVPSRRKAPLVALVIWSVAATVALVICVIGIANANNAATSGVPRSMAPQTLCSFP